MAQKPCTTMAVLASALVENHRLMPSSSPSASSTSLICWHWNTRHRVCAGPAFSFWGRRPASWAASQETWSIELCLRLRSHHRSRQRRDHKNDPGLGHARSIVCLGRGGRCQDEVARWYCEIGIPSQREVSWLLLPEAPALGTWRSSREIRSLLGWLVPSRSPECVRRTGRTRSSGCVSHRPDGRARVCR